MDIFVDNLVQVWDDGGDGIVALDGISHQFRSSKLTCLLGPSGCGKSTLVQVVGGIEKATSGTIRIVDPANPSAPSARPGQRSVMMWQNLNLFPWRNVIDNVTFGPEMLGVGKDARYERARELIALVGLKHFELKQCSQLSGGMRQRVALARALAADPEVLLMDEPLSALDALTRATLQDELIRIVASTGATVLMVTHDVDEAVLLSDRVVMMTNGPAATIGDVLEVDLPRPRERLALVSNARYVHLRARVLEFLYHRQAKKAA